MAINITPQLLEAALFIQGEPMRISALTTLFGCSKTELLGYAEALEQRLKERGGATALMKTDTELTLVTTGEAHSIVEKMNDDLVSRDIGQAGLEVLSILLYKGASTRATIDYIRGVNSASTIRLLLTRGLIKRMKNPDDAREFIYKPTIELLAHLGTPNVSELPEYASIHGTLEEFAKSEDTKEHEQHGSTHT